MSDPGQRGRRLPPIRKSLGQHFLNDKRILQRIVDALELSGDEIVIEIGPGRGSLTELLVPRARSLILIEYDRMLAANLRQRYATTPTVRVIEADVLTVDLGAAAGGPYRLVGNVPYYITTPILFHALAAPRPDRAVYLVQREVADRIVAAPGSADYGALSVNVQGFARAQSLFRVAPGSFLPPPKVEGAVIRIEPRTDPVVGVEEEAAFRRFVQDAFGMRRKQMRRVIRELAALPAETAEAVLSGAGVKAEARPETLGAEQFARVFGLLRTRG
ncbi:MAG TPA: 16S rRNA (adenine(1518)-N(6)/adenine(1519)-N(6))-dimethyltransferase RsmA [Gemmatimonadaceae bacterium]|nr:16S rRNA (adenine(1518)-N(6)/adenine(1519)-N(6))-dimethyltransferase RsmA [Gemmatimonadaceae bacterium]